MYVILGMECGNICDSVDIIHQGFHMVNSVSEMLINSITSFMQICPSFTESTKFTLRMNFLAQTRVVH